ncbi:thylakoid lumenal 17.4 kDa protein, chloroplastic isoform X3 [Gossypium hirsutum]|uniref:Thylakoid lumenal 17.4 kDa protein, chloroplastic isoform X3 n=1 Tax=Gossypium hirsutum TaxID=3635 RepID=A0ABM3BAV6_GOSHI|nr:thylakoid lumenal 17.4 kDa protein, chloroplastic-like isoform X3 [Gossypium hirsutum]
MGSIAQSVLMALTVTVNQFASSNVHAVHRKQGKSPPPTSKPKPTNTKTITAAAANAGDTGIARRGLILYAVASAPQLNDSRTELLKKYLKKTEENKAKNDKERMENYYRRNYKDYFEFVEGTLKGKDEQQLSEAEKASKRVPKSEESSFPFKELRTVACGLLAVCTVATASPVIAANQRLPPLSTEPNRCERAFVGNTIGQANGVYDKPLDLRFCDYTNEKSNLKGKSLAAALMSDAKFDGADMSEAVMSKAYAVGASFKGTDFSNAVLDRVNFGKANLQGAIFKNTVLSGSTFDNAQLEDAVFEDTIIGYIDLQKLCTNTSISAEGRVELGCR